MRERPGLTRRQLARDLGISQNCIPAIERGACRAGRKLHEQSVKYFRCRIVDLFEIVLINPGMASEEVLKPRSREKG